MAAVELDILIEQGASFSKQFTLKDGNGTAIDITGYTFRSQIRKTYSDPGTVASFTCAIVTAASGIFSISLTAVETAALQVPKASGAKKTLVQCAWDLEAVKPDTTVLRIAEGIASISPEVTR